MNNHELLAPTRFPDMAIEQSWMEHYIEIWQEMDQVQCLEVELEIERNKLGD